MEIASSYFGNHHVSQALRLVNSDSYSPIPHHVFTELSTRIPRHWAWSDDPYEPTHQRWLYERVIFCRNHLLKSLQHQQFIRSWSVILHPYPNDILKDIALKLGIDSGQVLICDRSLSDDPQVTQTMCVSREVHKRSYELTRSLKPHDLVVVSKIDSDDWYARKYSYYIQLAIQSLILSLKVPRQQAVLDLPFGAQHLTKTARTYATQWSESGFVNMLSAASFIRDRATPYRTPYSFSHDDIPADISKILISTCGPSWFSAIHDDNISNSMFNWSYDPASTDLHCNPATA